MRGWIALSAVVLLALAAFVIYELIPTDTVRKATVNQAVVKFRKEMKRAASYPKHPEAQIPPFGVYRYATRGAEEIKILAFTGGHRYGRVTAVTVTPTRCGVMERWQPLVESWSEGELCLAPTSSRVVAVRNFHQFFGDAKLARYSCVGGSAPYTPELRPGMGWLTRCSSAGGTAISKVKVIGLEEVKVGSRPIEAVHLRSAVKLSGDPDGSDSQDSWLRRSDGLLLRRTESSKVHVAAAGGDEFSEHYEIDLISTKSQR